MLRFNEKQEQQEITPDIFQYILCYGSTPRLYRSQRQTQAFQYILCYGSTAILEQLKKGNSYFNTSYVTVQHIMERHRFSDFL